jgi:hypothetical protein
MVSEFRYAMKRPCPVSTVSNSLLFLMTGGIIVATSPSAKVACHSIRDLASGGLI